MAVALQLTLLPCEPERARALPWPHATTVHACDLTDRGTDASVENIPWATLTSVHRESLDEQIYVFVKIMLNWNF